MEWKVADQDELQREVAHLNQVVGNIRNCLIDAAIIKVSNGDPSRVTTT